MLTCDAPPPIDDMTPAKRMAAAPLASRLAAYLQLMGAPDEQVGVIHVDLRDADNIALGGRVLERCLGEVCRLLDGGGSADAIGPGALGIVQPLLEGSRQARALAQRLSALLDGPLEVIGRSVMVKARIGVAIAPGDGADAQSLLEHASLAAGHVRCDPRRRPQFYLPEMAEQRAFQRWLANELPTALQAGQLSLVYQPQLDLACNRIVAAEALLRWRHPERGAISPVEFV